MDRVCRRVATLIEARYAPRDGFIVFLAQGWRFAGDIAEPMIGHHGAWSVLLVREP